MFLTVRAAATQLGTSKSSVFRAIRTGKLSAERTDDGGYRINTRELSRAFGAERILPRNAPQDGAGNGAGTVSVGAPGDAVEFRLRAMALEVEVRLLREQAQELRSDRDAWRSTAERLLISAPIIPAAPTSTPQPRQSWWWKWRQAS